jgi:hypothetical protein
MKRQPNKVLQTYTGKEYEIDGGLLLTKESLWLDLSIRSLLIKRKILSPGEVFGGPRFP